MMTDEEVPAGERERDLLARVPIRKGKWVVEGGRVRIIVPKFGGRIGRGLLRLAHQPPTYRINLDEYGTLVWSLCDGTRTVGAIGEEMMAEFGPGMDRVHERLEWFLAILEGRGLISYK